MWSDAQLLLFLLAALYAAECLVWVPARAVFLRARDRKWSPATVSGPVGNRNGAFLPISLLPGCHRAAIWSAPAFSPGPDGVVAFTPDQPGPLPRPAQSLRALAWSDIAGLVLRDRDLRHGGDLFVRARHAGEARRWLDLLRSLAAEKGGADRAPAIARRLAEELSVDAAREALDRAAAAARAPAVAGVLSFLCCFVAGPVVVWHFGVARALPWVFAAAVAFHLPVVALAFRAHRRLRPAARGERWIELCKNLLSPPMAMRAPDLLWLRATEGRHPLALLAAAGEKDTLRDLARRLLLDLRNPIAPDECPAEARRHEAWFRQARLDALGPFLAAQGIDANALAAPPAATEPGLRTHCPRCHQAFSLESGVCAACGGMPLQPFPHRGAPS